MTAEHRPISEQALVEVETLANRIRSKEVEPDAGVLSLVICDNIERLVAEIRQLRKCKQQDWCPGVPVACQKHVDQVDQKAVNLLADKLALEGKLEYANRLNGEVKRKNADLTTKLIRILGAFKRGTPIGHRFCECVKCRDLYEAVHGATIYDDEQQTERPNDARPVSNVLPLEERCPSMYGAYQCSREKDHCGCHIWYPNPERIEWDSDDENPKTEKRKWVGPSDVDPMERTMPVTEAKRDALADIFPPNEGRLGG